MTSRRQSFVVDPWIDHVLGHAIKLVVRRDSLDLGAFVLRAVIAEAGKLIEPPHHRRPAARRKQSEAAEEEGAPSDPGRIFEIVRRVGASGEKTKSEHQRPFEGEEGKSEPEAGDQGRGPNRPALITRAQLRPKQSDRDEKREQKENA